MFCTGHVPFLSPSLRINGTKWIFIEIKFTSHAARRKPRTVLPLSPFACARSRSAHVVCPCPQPALVPAAWPSPVCPSVHVSHACGQIHLWIIIYRYCLKFCFHRINVALKHWKWNPVCHGYPFLEWICYDITVFESGLCIFCIC